MEFEFFLVPLKFENAEIEDISESIPTLMMPHPPDCFMGLVHSFVTISAATYSF